MTPVFPLARGDSRLSIEERYPSFAVYASAVTRAIEDMVAGRTMLREDAQSAVNRLLSAGQATGAIKMDSASRDLPGK